MPFIPARCARSMKRTKSRDRKSTRLNSSHQIISYAVFCLKKKKEIARGQDSSVDVRQSRSGGVSGSAVSGLGVDYVICTIISISGCVSRLHLSCRIFDDDI